MAKRPSQNVRVLPRADFHAPRVGRIVKVDEQGQAWVDFAGNPTGRPVSARSVLDAAAPPTAAPDALVGAEVLLTFENADPLLPIVTGIVRARLQPEPSVPAVTLAPGTLKDVLVDGRQLVFSAQQQILLRCGKSSVLLRRDGKVVIRGTHLLSRSSGANKIKGASIDLN
ncbi:MAG TPA: DUF6484 domain-containing protein [Polyangiales bacterium]|nr:DUF6484 domain-containing protein [Polyangiales bacterium]